MANVSPSEFPLRFGAPEMFAEARSALIDAGFEESRLCDVLKLAALSELGRLKRAAVDFQPVSTRLKALIELFLFGESVVRAEVEEAFNVEQLKAFLELDLLRPAPSDLVAVRSPVFLYPVSGLLIASDRQSVPGTPEESVTEDSVFAAIFPGTLRFLKILPAREAGDALDLCSGTGIGALKMSGGARRVVATDLTARSVHFSRFNALLNGCGNVEAAQGDLYEAVPGQTFDVITAHPPYVPSLGDHAVYRDGGDAGETVVRRIVEGLPNALRRGGTFYSMSVGLDTTAGQFEERARGWLGSAQDEFDVIFAYGDEKSPDQAVADIVSRAKHVKTLNPAQLKQAYEQMGVRRLVYGALVIHRRDSGAGKPWTARPTIGAETTGADFDWLLGWHRQAEDPGFVECLAGARPVLSPHLQVKATHVVADGALVPAEFSLEASCPFETATRVDPWVVPLIAQLDGRRSVEDLHRMVQAAGEVPGSFGVTDFAKLTALLVERGCLVLDLRDRATQPSASRQ